MSIFKVTVKSSGPNRRVETYVAKEVKPSAELGVLLLWEGARDSSTCHFIPFSETITVEPVSPD